MVLLNYLLQFIEEDAPSGDVTSAAIIPDITCNAVIRAEQEESLRVSMRHPAFFPFWCFC